MYTNVNLEAALGVLALVGTGLLLLALGAVFVYLLVRRRFGGARVAFLSAVALAGLYLTAMLLFSLLSRECVLARGEEKYFCEIDCHLAYAVTDVRRAETLGDATANGEFWVVTVRTRFDEQTISTRRGDAPLTPNPRRLAVYDASGRRYPVSEAGERALRASGEAGTPLDTPLRPGESYLTRVVFDLPAEARDPRLLINEEPVPTRLIIGHENSLLHRRTLFQLAPRA